MTTEATTPATTPVTTEAAPQTPAAPERPAWLPEKFKTPEDLAKSYTELEKKLGAGKPKDDLAIPAQSKPTPEPELPVTADFDYYAEKAGQKLPDLVAEWEKSGKLTDEQYAAFKKIGYSQTMVNRVIKADMVIKENLMHQAADLVGSKEQYANLMQWAGNGGLTQEEVAQMNADIAKDTEHNFIPTVERILLRHKNAMGAGKAQPLVNAGTGAQTAGAYKSGAESAAVVNSKPYRDNAPGVREQHQRRIALTPPEVLSRW